jgi:putative ABC transport system substrate-binding protein
MKTRRQLLVAVGASALIGMPLTSFAQSPGKVWRIGMLETVSPELNAANLDAFRQGLRELGYVEGRNLIVEYRSADGRAQRFPDLATELVSLKVDLIVTRGTPAAVAAKKATRTIPVIMANAGDPVGSGLVTSLARPGGNVTGLSSVPAELDPKRLELLRELVPGSARIAVLLNMSSPNNPPQWKEMEMAARALGVQPQLLDVRKPEDLGPAFDVATKQRADGLIVGGEGLFQANRKMIAELAAKHRLPAIYRSMDYIEAGGLMAYGPDYPDLYRRAATYVDKIFKGAKPGDLPVEQPTKFELIFNLKAAKALGLTIPVPLLLRADKVIE